MSVAFEGHICCWHIYGCSMENTSCNFVFLTLCAVMWGFCVAYNIRPHDQKVTLQPISIIMTKGMLMVQLTTLLAPCDANTSAKGANDQNCHIAPYFNCLDLRNAKVPLITPLASHCHIVPQFSFLNIRNAMVPLMILLASFDTDVSASGIQLPKCHDAPHCSCLYLRNVMVP